MEPADLKNFPSEEDDRLHALLAGQMSPLPDAGFTRRVTQALPPRAISRVPPVGWALAGALAGLGLAWVKGATWTGLIAGTTELAQAGTALLALATNPWFVLALTTVGLSLLLTFVITRQFSARYR